MTQTFVVNQKPATRTPYLRGILTRSLQKAGLPFEKAYRLASQLRDDIADQREISSQELRERVIRMLEERYDASVCQRYLANREEEKLLLIRHPDQQLTPFSRGLHQRALVAVGITAHQARSITSRLYHRLLTQELKEISSRQLGHLTYQAICSDLNKSTARRYLIWTAFRHSERPLIILIGGAPGCGKSTISVELANRMEIIRTQSTDMLREVMRMMMPMRLAPVLHESSFNAWKALSDGTPSTSSEKIRLLANGYHAQADLLSVPCEAVVRRALRENISLILEGVHVSSTLLDRLPTDESAILVPMMLAVMNAEDLRNRIHRRDGLVPRTQAERYLRHFDDIWQLQSLLLDDADKQGIPIINSTDTAAAAQEAIHIIIEALSPEFSADANTVFGPPDAS
ncbi:MAG: zeta toxin family protein [Gammaproteobacteria bacterium]|nr:zeta toxin family protein [Gammaproteobacteria bacterium]